MVAYACIGQLMRVNNNNMTMTVCYNICNKKKIKKLAWTDYCCTTECLLFIMRYYCTILSFVLLHTTHFQSIILLE